MPTVTGAALNLANGASAKSTVAHVTKIPATTVPLAGSVVRSVKSSGATSAVLRSENFGQTWTAEPVPSGAKGVPEGIVCQSASDCEVVGGYRTYTYPLSDLAAASTTRAGATWDVQLP